MTCLYEGKSELKYLYKALYKFILCYHVIVLRRYRYILKIYKYRLRFVEKKKNIRVAIDVCTTAT